MKKFIIKGAKGDLTLKNDTRSIDFRATRVAETGKLSLVAWDSADNPAMFLKDSLVEGYDYWKIVMGDGFSSSMYEPTIEVSGKESKVFTLDENDSVLDRRTKSLSYKDDDGMEMTVFLHESESHDNVAMDFVNEC